MRAGLQARAAGHADAAPPAGGSDGLQASPRLVAQRALIGTVFGAAAQKPRARVQVHNDSARSGPLVQRKILIDGQSPKGKAEVMDALGPLGLGPSHEPIVDAMMDQRAGTFAFGDYDQLMAELVMRATMIDSMRELNRSGTPFGYNWDGEDLNLPPGWQSVDYQWKGSGIDKPKIAFALQAGTSASVAIDAIFNAAGGEEYFLDCSSAILATQYSALLAAYRSVDEESAFNRKYRSLAITQEGIDHVQLPGQNEYVSPPGEELTDEVTVRDVEALVPGDSVYFVNFRDYDATHAGPEAAWAGEHAVYFGEGKFQGFGSGSDETSYEDMIALLIDRYNKQGTNDRHHPKTAREPADDTMDRKRPGLLTKVRRLKRPAL